MTVQRCPICSAVVTTNRRYPHYVCGECEERAADASGRSVAFFNESASGGCVGNYTGTGEPYLERQCFIDGVRCLADEAHFGGIVIEPVEHRDQR